MFIMFRLKRVVKRTHFFENQNKRTKSFKKMFFVGDGLFLGELRQRFQQLQSNFGKRLL